MDDLLKEYHALERTGNLSKTLGDVQKVIDLLTSAREALVTGKR
jgi:hypothetical protein